MVTLLVLGALFIHKGATEVGALTVPDKQYGLLSSPFTKGTMLFSPDIMLGRAVEKLMDEEGAHVPFRHLMETVANYDVALANFEASVPEKHVVTPTFGLKFSVKEEYIGELAESGFDILSLANNHALDNGESGYTHTKDACGRQGLVCVGHPNKVDESSVVTTEVGDIKVSVLMLHTLSGDPSTTTLATLLADMVRTTDMQYAFIHWGDEYEPVHNTRQAALAHFLVDNGIDAVIGHHPHVVQDIEEYNGKPIFYSLGNLIFDQYWNDEVQKGYMIGATFEKRSVSYELIPYDMLEKRSVPKLKGKDERATMLDKLLSPTYFTEEERAEGILKYVR